MSERGNFRGRSGGVGGSGGGGGRDRGNAGQRGGRGGGHAGQAGEKPKKENILDLTKYMDKEIAVKFNGGREDDEGNESSRSLGLIVARGTLLVLISPLDGSEQIANPFNQQEED
ncbi:Sm-like protein lsm7 [Puttea exsequens]|nr:Sm-like protein lsm7 [Puttea exsequens]